MNRVRIKRKIKKKKKKKKKRLVYKLSIIKLKSKSLSSPESNSKRIFLTFRNYTTCHIVIVTSDMLIDKIRRKQDS